jgi:hypothetical protein
VIAVYAAILFVIPSNLDRDRDLMFQTISQRYNFQNSDDSSLLPKGTIIIRNIQGKAKDNDIRIIDCYVPTFFKPAFLTNIYYGSASGAKFWLKNRTIPTSVTGGQTRVFVNNEEKKIRIPFLSASSFVSKEQIENFLQGI